MTDALKPCPFCGGQAEHGAIEGAPDQPDTGGHFIQCRVCGASTNLRFACGDDPRPLLVEQWNRRAPQPAQADHPEGGLEMVDVLQLARKAAEGRHADSERDAHSLRFDELERFAALVLEEAAKECDIEFKRARFNMDADKLNRTLWNGAALFADQLGEAIRALKPGKP